MFENEHRVGADECAINARDYQDMSIADYSTWNTYMMQCNKEGEQKLEDFSSKHNNLHYRNGYGFTTACVVDNDTDLRLNGKITHEKPKTQLFSRSFVAVPDLARGVVVPNLLSRLVSGGEDTTQVRECNRLTELDWQRFTPLIPCLKDNVQNVKHVVLPFPQNGENSRILMKNSQTLNKCGYRDNGNGNWQRPKQ